MLADTARPGTVPAMRTSRERRGAIFPTAAFLPLTAVSLGLQRHASLQASGDHDGWRHAAGVHIAAVVLLAGSSLVGRLRRDRGTASGSTGERDTRTVLVHGAALLAVPALLVIWSRGTLSFAAAGIAAIAAALAALRRGPDAPATRPFATPVLLAATGVVLLVFGRNAGLGLPLGPSLYLPLSRGPRHPDASTLLSLSALVAAGIAWAALWRRAHRHGYHAPTAGRTTLLLLAPGAFALGAGSLLTGNAPDLGPWTLVGGAALAASVHGTMRLAAGASPAAAGVATLGGCLAAGVATRAHYDNAFTTPMLAGAGLVAAGLVAARRQVRRHGPRHATETGTP